MHVCVCMCVCVMCVCDYRHTYILCTSQAVGRLPGPGAYGISKTALFGLTKALSVELGVENIRVNCLAPGVIKTNFSSAVSNHVQ